MVATTHLLVGITIGKITGDIWLTMPLAFASHYILDAIPHYNASPVVNFKEKGFRGMCRKDLLTKAIEPVVGVAVSMYAILANPGLALVMFLGGLFSMIPDFILFWEWKYNNYKGFISRFERTFHRHIPMLQGSIVQVVFSVLALIYIFN